MRNTNDNTCNASDERYVINTCAQDCKICYRHGLYIRWIISSSALLILVLGGMVTAITVNMQDIRMLTRDGAVATEQITYVAQGINDIKKAMGLEIRLPPRLEALK